LYDVVFLAGLRTTASVTRAGSAVLFQSSGIWHMCWLHVSRSAPSHRGYPLASSFAHSNKTPEEGSRFVR